MLNWSKRKNGQKAEMDRRKYVNTVKNTEVQTVKTQKCKNGQMQKGQNNQNAKTLKQSTRKKC